MSEITIPNCPRCGTQLVKIKDKSYYGCPKWLPDNAGCEGTIWWPSGEKEKRYPDILFSVKIESKSRAGFFHQVKFYENGNVWCSDCMAREMGKFCSYQKKAIEKIEEVIAKIKKENKYVSEKLPE